MADEPNKTTSWWATLPGILTATAAVITAVTGLVAILSQAGVFGEKSKTFVTQKASEVRDAVSTGPARIDPVRPVDPPVVAATVKGGAATGVTGAPLQAAPFTGAVVTLRNGTVVKLRDDIKEYCQGRPILKTLDGQFVEMARIRRFELSDWNASNQRGNAHIVLNNGEVLDVKIEGCFMVGTNDLGDYRGPFEDIRTVEFVR